MNELAVKEKEFNPYAIALKCDRLTAIKESVAKKHVSEVVTRCLNDLSHKMTQADYQVFCESAFQEIKLMFPQCTTGEFQMLCFNGIRGAYGETIGMSVVNLHKWIKGFLNSEQRIKAKAELKALESVTKEVDEAKLRAEYISVIENQFNNYKKTGMLKLTFAGVLYNEFELQGFINLTTPVKQILYNDAKKKIIEQKKVARLKCSSVQRMEIVKMLDRLESDLENKTDKSQIVIESKAMAIKRFYDSIQEFPKDFK